MTEVKSWDEVPVAITGYLDNWVYDELWNVVWGNIYDDANGRFVDGTWIHTSGIPGGRQMEFSEGDLIKTLNSKYILRNPRKGS